MKNLKGRLKALEERLPPLPEPRPELTDQQGLELFNKLIKEAEQEELAGLSVIEPGCSGLSACQRLDLVRSLIREYGG